MTWRPAQRWGYGWGSLCAVFKEMAPVTKPWADFAHNLLAIDLGLDVQNYCHGLQQKLQHAECFTCHPLITYVFRQFHCYFQDFTVASNLLQLFHCEYIVCQMLHQLKHSLQINPCDEQNAIRFLLTTCVMAK